MLEHKPRQWLLGVGACFSGAALLGHIFFDVPLYLGVAVTFVLALAAVGLGVAKTPPAHRKRFAQTLWLGTWIGLIATGVYDAVKWGLSQWDPSPYNPFEAINVFGQLLIGSEAGSVAVMVAGTGFHILNGTCFAVAYCFLFGRRGWWAGVLWGIFLEAFQFTLYPDWLGVRFLKEFYTISALSHVVYGLVLGVGCRWGLQWIDRRLMTPATAA